MAKDDISREKIFETVVAEAGALYRSVVTIAGAFLGGTLLFLEKILANPPPVAILFMALGWLCLLFSVVAITNVRVDNLESGRLALLGEFDDASKLDDSKSSRTKRAVRVLALGLLFIMIAGLYALWRNG